MDNSEKLIGEAAYRLLVRQETVSVAHLLNELTQMAAEAESTARQSAIGHALSWLQDYRQPSSGKERGNHPLQGFLQDETAIKLNQRDRQKE